MLPHVLRSWRALASTKESGPCWLASTEEGYLWMGTTELGGLSILGNQQGTSPDGGHPERFAVSRA